MVNIDFKYLRIQGLELAENTMYAKGVFSMCWQLIQNDVMIDEDADLFREIDDWFAHNLPWPPQCQNQEKVVCFFKTVNTEEMMKMIKPALWLLDRYDHPYYLVYTNTPGEIVYEDKYQVVVRVPGTLQVEKLQAKWGEDAPAEAGNPESAGISEEADEVKAVSAGTRAEADEAKAGSAGTRADADDMSRQRKASADISFRKAAADDLPDILRIYDHSHDAEEAGKSTTGWKRGIYPTLHTAEEALARDDMYVAELEGRIMAAGVINQIQVDVYADCDWEYKAPDEKVSVLHTLAVEPDARGLGAGPAFVRFWEALAREQGCAVLRIDTNEINLRARKMYARLGYKERDIVPTVFNGLKNVDLVLMEKKL